MIKYVQAKMFTQEEIRLKQIKANVSEIQNGISEACAKSGRKPSEISLMSVTKYASAEDIRLFISAGITDIVGENKVQSVKARWIDGELADLRKQVSLHLIGHLQTNKAKAAVEIFDSIDSIDSIKIAKAVNRHAEEAGRIMPVLVQIKLTKSETQSGIAPEEASALVREMRQMSNLNVCGYMAIAPAFAGSDEIQKSFQTAKDLFDRDFSDKEGAILSLGMSEDYREAVMSGSTMLRIGGAFFK